MAELCVIGSADAHVCADPDANGSLNYAVAKQELASVATMISLSDKQFEEWLELQKELRKLLRGLLAAKDESARQKTRPAKS